MLQNGNYPIDCLLCTQASKVRATLSWKWEPYNTVKGIEILKNFQADLILVFIQRVQSPLPLPYAFVLLLLEYVVKGQL